MGRMFWNMRYKVIVWLSCFFVFILAFPIEHLWRYGWSPATAKWIGVYFTNFLYSVGLSVFAEVPEWLTRAVTQPDIAAIMPLLPIAIYFILTDETLLKEFNPFGKDVLKEESSRKANDEDIKKMGLLDGFMMVLGYWKKKTIDDERNIVCALFGTPGTGKTQGVVLPTIFECTGVSMIINDPKPELKQQSSAYRAQNVGPVFIMNWAGQDDPMAGIHYPSWNPLSPSHVPFITEERDLYIDSICATLIADKTSSSADPHWTISGRAALSGLINFMVSKIDKAKADEYFLCTSASRYF